jgi:threonine/homoserine/homoserine lactone efflux protein
MALVTRQVVTRGYRAAQVTILGNLSGLVVHASALAVGLSALRVASASAYTRPRIKATLERATGAVLVALGLRVAVAHR